MMISFVSHFGSAIRRVIERYTVASLPSIPPNIKKTGYGLIQLHRKEMLLNSLVELDSLDVVESENPLSMESVGQVCSMFFFLGQLLNSS